MRAKAEGDLHRSDGNGTPQPAPDAPYGGQRDADELAAFTQAMRGRLRLVEPVAEPEERADPVKVRKAVALAVASMRKYAAPEGRRPQHSIGEQLAAVAKPLELRADPRLQAHLAQQRADLARRAAERVGLAATGA